ncbi:DUF6087 family protein [Streptomyces cacaoi]|uniref:DUF6087 family protein n=1 Tax=Streptomyces cacaoi TaxID=1898 RepID=UPI0026330451|nr:DUF6087 family protein [Streptomyces cacaoi]
MDDESFEQWVHRREEERRRSTGRLRSDALRPGPPRGAHVDPAAPRLISRWDGYAWEPVAVAPDHPAAAAAMRPPADAPPGADTSRPATADRRSARPERRKSRVRRLLTEPPFSPDPNI